MVIHLQPLQKQALEQTKAVFPPLKQKIEDALSKLEQQIVRLLISRDIVRT